MGDLYSSGFEVVRGARGSLVGVVGPDALRCHLERLPQIIGDALQGGGNLLRWDSELAENDLVELLGEGTESVVATGPDGGDDGGHHLGRTKLFVFRPRERLHEGGAVTGKSSEVETAEQHGLPMLPGHDLHPGAGSAAERCHDRVVTNNTGELSSIATALEELTRRVTAHADAADAEKEDDTAKELFAIERALTGASRRLSRLTASLRGR
jgi:hypothetical protein